LVLVVPRSNPLYPLGVRSWLAKMLAESGGSCDKTPEDCLAKSDAKPDLQNATQAGVTAMGANYVTVKVIGKLFIPARLAVILVSPVATPLADPPRDIVALVLSELVHSTLGLMSAVEPSA
jgi:hypothetical protein